LKERLVAETLADLLESARQSYRRGDRREGATYAEEVLARDFLHPEIWELLHEQYGRGRAFEEFQRDFVQKFYPQMLPILERGYPEAEMGDQERDAAASLPFPLNRMALFFRRIISPQSRSADNPPPPGSQEITQPRPYRESLPFPASEILETEAVSEPQSRFQAQPEPHSPDSSYSPNSTPMGKSSPPESEIPISVPSVSDRGRVAKSDWIRVMIVDDIAEVRENITRSLKFQEGFEIVAIASGGLEAIKKARNTRPDVVLMDVNMPDMDGITASAKILEYLPGTQVIMLTVQDDPDYMRSAMRAGASDYLVKPPMIDELLSSVQRAGTVAKIERAKRPVNIATPTEGALDISRGRLITVYSPKGGAGCTLLAANLAASLHNDETQVILVDADLYYGNLIVHFNEQSETTILDLAARADELDPQLVEEVLVTHESGIKILAAPKRPEYAEIVTGAQFTSILKYLRDRYPYVIVDLPHRLSDVALAAFDASDVLVLLTTQDVPAIAHTREFIQLLPRLRVDLSKVLVVMSQYDENIKVDPERVSHSLRKDIVTVIPRDNHLVIRSINQGLPILLQNEWRSEPVARAIFGLAEAVRRKVMQGAKVRKPA
jgi:pilus assembly protein CpaE